MLRRSLDRLQSSETVILSGLALIVGLASGAGVWLFKRLIDLFHQLAFTNLVNVLAPLDGWTVVLIPVIGGLVVGLILHYFIGEERHHGVAGIMEAVALAGGRLRYQRVPAKAVAAALSIGSGASVGPEDPSVQIGANLGSMFGQWLGLSDERMRALAAAGAASGIAAAFNAPIAGVFFALEIILGEISGSAFGLVVISAVISAVFTQAVSGPEPAFHVPTYALNSAGELPFYLALGLFAGPVAALYIRLLYATQDLFHQGVRLPNWIKPALAGLAVGLVGRFLPQIFGVGYDTIEKILGGESPGVMILLALMLAKVLLTSASIGGGFPGGVFAPALFIGATLGAAVGQLAGQLFPGLNIVPGAFAMVGMAAVLAGAVHAPLTSIILLFEMTHDYRIILPVMFAVVVSMLVAQRLQRDSVYTLGLARKGIRLERGRDVEVLETVSVAEVMQPPPFTLNESDTLAQAADRFQKSRHHGVPVMDEQGGLIGVFTLQDLDDIPADEWPNRRVGEACTRELLVAYPDESIGSALRRMGTRDVGRLPVVRRENPRQLLGLLRRSDLVRAYDAALTRRAAMRHRAQQVRLGSLRGDEVSVLEVTLDLGAPCTNKLVKEVAWPRECVIASVRRGRRLLIPHGDTRLQAGDVLVFVAEGAARQEVLKLVKASAETS
jgi:CIC family chloride channel protein